MTLLAEIRPVRMEDLQRILQLESRVWQKLGASLEELKRRFLLFPQGFIIAVAGTEILGFSCSFMTDTDATAAALSEAFPPRHVPRGDYFFLFGLTVDPVFRRRGIARSLVAEQLAVAEKLGCRKVQLIANSWSRPLFEDFGFRVVRPAEELYVNYRDVMPEPVLMEKALK
ncbi:MAG TPA: GNAT family N-acetyltransferase [Acidobacteriota bacterium]|nr:GNAT family N-acetyltransferase [Acidobacteriota bacterium]